MTPAPPPGWWADLLERTQAGPTRRRLTGNLLALGDVLPPVFIAVAGLLAAVWRVPPQHPGLLGFGLFVVVFSALTKLLKHGLDLREKALKAALEAELPRVAAQASFQVLSHWRAVARHHEDGMEKANRQLQEGMHFNPDERVGADACDAYLRAIIAVFGAFYEAHDGEFTANLTVPNAARTALWLVRIEPGGGGRSNNVPRAIDLASEDWGAAVAFRTGRIVYTADVRQHGNAGDRGYLSVVNIPVLGSHGEVVATVNVDSPQVGAFGSGERVNGVWAYCLPVLSSLSLYLNDVRLFRAERR